MKLRPKCLLVNKIIWFDVFSTVHHSIELFHQPTLMHNFLYSLTICLLHYYHRHVSRINMPIFRMEFCIHTASGIFALCKSLYSKLVESGLRSQPVYSKHVEDNKVTNILLMNKENCALKLVDEIILKLYGLPFSSSPKDNRVEWKLNIFIVKYVTLNLNYQLQNI